jgi:hypothetical protein
VRELERVEGPPRPHLRNERLEIVDDSGAEQPIDDAAVRRRRDHRERRGGDQRGEDVRRVERVTRGGVEVPRRVVARRDEIDGVDAGSSGDRDRSAYARGEREGALPVRIETRRNSSARIPSVWLDGIRAPK